MQTLNDEELYDVERDDWERICWHIQEDCQHKYLNAYSIPEHYLPLLGTNVNAQQRRARWSALFLLPVYWRSSAKLGRTRIDKGWHVHHDWEHRITLMQHADDIETLKPYWDELHRKAIDMYLSRTMDLFESDIFVVNCGICQHRGLSTTTIADTVTGWHAPKCYVKQICERVELTYQTARERMTAYDPLLLRLEDPTLNSHAINDLVLMDNLDSRARYHLARNPNTPALSLEKLFKGYAGEVLANPALPLILIEHPRWFRHLADDPTSRHILTLTTKEPLIEPSARYRDIIDQALRETERLIDDPFPF